MAERAETNTTPKRKRRVRKTRPSVKVMDRVARTLITVGGLGTIASVMTVCVFLVWVVVPLFQSESLRTEDSRSLGQASPPALNLVVDEYQSLAFSLRADGALGGFRVDDGSSFDMPALFGDARPTSYAFASDGKSAVFGFADGTIQLSRIDYETAFLATDDPATQELESISVGSRTAFGAGVVERVSHDRFRVQTISSKVGERVALAGASDSPAGSVVLIDHSVLPTGPAVAAFTADGRLWIQRVREKKNWMTGKVTASLSGGHLEVGNEKRSLPPRYLKLSGVGDTAYLIWKDGHCVRIDLRNTSKPVVAERLDLLKEPSAELTDVAFLTGKTTLVTGDTLGRVRTWFPVRPESTTNADGLALTSAHAFEGSGAPVGILAPSPRSRMIAASYDDQTVRLFHITSSQQLAEARIEQSGGRIEALTVTPKDDAVLALAGGSLDRWSIDAAHPETTIASLFRPVWYESYPAPRHAWQSSSATDDFEPKLGLMPLIFGTLKATFYSMLFGVPIALLAAIYTSEFLPSHVKARVKPTIELMASLPSVVLGFLAALVFAPLVEDVVPETISAFLTIPLALLLCAYSWQMLPRSVASRVEGYRFLFATVAVPAGVILALAAGPILESLLFSGDMVLWLDGQVGSSFGAWVLFTLPASALIAFFIVGRYFPPQIGALTISEHRSRLATISFLRFLATLGTAVAVSILLGFVLNAAGFDARGAFLGTYVQRNAMIVGFVMGFAVIPIIYTIADDALSSIPEHLRSGSLAVGATPWQTTVRVVIPTAMSGLFSAIMVGLGRAVGETMIVLMAAGNTPVMEWNVFNGFRTLSANIAVELPEAVRNSTHYRTLFLAALSLFVMTFVLNTAAEVIRLRFRKRAFEL